MNRKGGAEEITGFAFPVFKESKKAGLFEIREKDAGLYQEESPLVVQLMERLELYF